MKRPCSLRSPSRLYIRALESISLSLPKFSEGCHRISVIPSYLSSGRVFSRTQPEYVMGSLFSCYWRSSVEITCNSGTLISKKWHEFCPTSLVWQSQLPALLTVHFSGRDYVPRSGGGWHACLFICCIFKLKCFLNAACNTTLLGGSQCLSFLEVFGPMVTLLFSGKHLLHILVTREPFVLLQTHCWLNNPVPF